MKKLKKSENKITIGCKIISLFTFKECHIRFKYSDKRFRLIRSLIEMKKLTPKYLELDGPRYKFRAIWLCYDIYTRSKCDLCGRSCGKGLIIKKNEYGKPIYNICNKCAIIELDNDEDVDYNKCNSCMDKYCNGDRKEGDCLNNTTFPLLKMAIEDHNKKLSNNNSKKRNKKRKKK